MPSPFSGMDPWLENVDIAGELPFAFTVHLTDSLNAVLPPGYVARSVRHDWFERARQARIEPVGVFPSPPVPSALVELPMDDELVETCDWGVEVFHVAKSNRVRLAVLEVVSYEARTTVGPARIQFEQRQRRDIWASANRVEIDLWRAGEPLAPVSERLLRRSAGWSGSCVYVMKADRPATLAVQPIRYDCPLPTITVPLGPTAGDVTIALQPVLDACYTGGAYHKRVRYDRPPETPLTDELQRWADGILRARGLLP